MPYAGREFLRSLRWIAVAGALMVAGSLWYLSLYGPLHPSMVVATTAGVFLSVLLGSGVFAARSAPRAERDPPDHPKPRRA